METGVSVRGREARVRRRAPVGGSRCLRRLDLPDLVARARADDEDAWAELIRRFASMVRNRALGVGLTPALADDAVQLTWIRLARALDDLREPERLPGWLRTTARNTAITLYRAERRLVPSDLLDHDGWSDPDGSTAPSPDAGLLVDDTTVAVQAAVTSLTERQRDLIRLHYLDDAEGRSYDELADQLDMPRGAIGPTLGRALHRMGRHPMIVRLR